MVSRRSIPKTYSYHRPLLSDVLPFEVPPTFGNSGFFDFLTRNNVRLEREQGKVHVVWESSSDQLDATISVLFKTCRKHPVGYQFKSGEGNTVANPFQRQVVRNGKTVHKRYWKLSSQAMQTRPYGFDISHKEREFRRLSVIHPRNQVAVADFYDEHSAQILYFAGLSDVSIRHPSAVAKTVRFSDRLYAERKSKVPDSIEQNSKEYENLGSFFSYKHYSNIFKFFEHYKYHNAEKKFDVLLRLDVAKCFDSIYTHSLPWSTLGTPSAKDHLGPSKNTFGGRFDALLQAMNQNETNGIVIGPEFSRIFAEVILQKVDMNFLAAMRKNHGYVHRDDFQAFRYVDDYFLFCSSTVDLEQIERELGVALKEMKLSVNSAKSEVVHKPIITDLTIAKNRVRQVFSDCIEVLETDVENPNDPDETVKKYTPRVRSNNLIVGFKSVLKETGVEYKNILNYSFAALERNSAVIFNKYGQTLRSLRDERRLVLALIGLLEFSFFVYAADPRVNISIRLARLISSTVDQMNKVAMDRDSKHQVLKYIFDNVSRQLKKSSVMHQPNVEVMYMILALRKLGREYLISEDALASYFGLSREAKSGKLQGNTDIDYFATTVGLCYSTGKKKYAGLRAVLEENIVQRIQARAAYVHNEAEPLMVYLDLCCCPYVSARTKFELGKVFGHSLSDLRSIKSASPFWFTDWKGFDLSIALDKKRTREVY